MFKFTDISDKDEFKVDEYRLSPREFLNKRRTSRRAYVFDLRGPNDYEADHLPGAHNLPVEHFENSIYQMPFSGDILLYGGEEGEVLTAAEILYDNGFDTFNFVDSYESILHNVDASYVKVTDDAVKHIVSRLQEDPGADWGVELLIEQKSPMKAFYRLEFIGKPETAPEDVILEFDRFRMLVHRDAIPFLEGTEVLFNEDKELEVYNPNLSISKLRGSIEEQVQLLLEEQINPMVASHGGIVSLHEVRDADVYLQFGGGCQGCGMIDVTLKQGIEVTLKENIPMIANVYDATDHSSGHNPFY